MDIRIKPISERKLDLRRCINNYVLRQPASYFLLKN